MFLADQPNETMYHINKGGIVLVRPEFQVDVMEERNMHSLENVQSTPTNMVLTTLAEVRC